MLISPVLGSQPPDNISPNICSVASHGDERLASLLSIGGQGQKAVQRGRLTLAGALDAVANANSLGVLVGLAILLADSLVGVVLEMAHDCGSVGVGKGQAVDAGMD